MKTNVIGWIARVLSVLGVGIILVFMIGEGFNPAHMTAREMLLSLFFPVGVCIGMIVGWFSEGLGGLITALSLVLFYVVNYAQRGHFPSERFSLLFSSGGLLFLVSWLYTRLRSGRANRG
ncbi:MAG: hypothetical protein V1873_02320 [Verrucomicrobiota bacterium]